MNESVASGCFVDLVKSIVWDKVFSSHWGKSEDEEAGKKFLYGMWHCVKPLPV